MNNFNPNESNRTLESLLKELANMGEEIIKISESIKSDAEVIMEEKQQSKIKREKMQQQINNIMSEVERIKANRK
ncbi:hypothetical protein [Psychrobacillus sp. FSL K6-1267]|uniref:hypothetical protein n=1 Tax=Psychrobacillus sp. FSL K6-1267 TaxID=2921543 RepID=UPI0030FB4153